MRINAAKHHDKDVKKELPVTLDSLQQSFETNFEDVKDKLHLAEEHLHLDSNRIVNQVTEIIREERDQKKNLATLMTMLIVLNLATAITAVVVVCKMVSP